MISWTAQVICSQSIARSPSSDTWLSWRILIPVTVRTSWNVTDDELFRTRTHPSSGPKSPLESAFKVMRKAWFLGVPSLPWTWPFAFEIIWSLIEFILKSLGPRLTSSLSWLASSPASTRSYAPSLQAWLSCTSLWRMDLARLVSLALGI